MHGIENVSRYLLTHDVLWPVAVVSAVTFIATLFIVPIVLARLPSDYFSHDGRRGVTTRSAQGYIRYPLLVMKNILGVVLIATGTLLLVLPGQGLLTIAVGLMLTDFPSKYRLERRFVRQRRILVAINWVRRRAGQAPLDVTPL